METKYKVGDKVLATKPNRQDHSEVRLVWLTGMNKFDKQILTIKKIDNSNNIYLCIKDGQSFWYHESWLTKAEEQPTEQVTKSIDWENRRWELVCSILVPDFDIPIADGINLVDDLIKQYKQTLK